MLNPIKLHDYTDSERSTWPSDEERQTAWNKSLYSLHRWEIIGVNGSVAFIDFEAPAADGKTLIHYESLYRTTKEYAYWMRQHPESKIKDASVHKREIQDIITLSVALTYRRIESYAEIDRTLYHEILRKWRFGTEGLLDSSSRVQEFLTQFKTFEDIPPHLIKTYRTKKELIRKKVLPACGLPWASTPQVRWEMDRFASRINGLRVSDSSTDVRPPLKEVNAAIQANQRSHFRALYDLKPYMRAETLNFRPQTLGIGKNTRGRGKRTVRTRFVPPTLMFKLLAYAAEFVAEHHEKSIGILASYYHREAASVSGTSLSISNASKVIKRFTISVHLLILVFTARRPKEVNLLRRDCLHGDDKDGWFFNIFIVKNLNEWVWVPIPPIVARAIQGLLAMLPELDPSDRLFKIPDITQRRPVMLRASDHIPLLAIDADAVRYQTKSGKDAEWDWLPRQTRRFTAALFYWRYDGPAEVVQYILRHVSIGETRPYIENDAELSTIWDEEAWFFERRLAETIADGVDEIGGAMGKRLVRARDLIIHNLRKNLLVIDPERLADGIQEIMRREMLVLIPQASVICSCPATSAAADRAMCRKQKGQGTDRRIGPDFTRAGPVPCSTCYWAIQNSRTRAFVAKETQELQLAVASPSRRGTIFGEIEKRNLVQLLQVEKKGGAKRVLIQQDRGA